MFGSSCELKAMGILEVLLWFSSFKDAQVWMLKVLCLIPIMVLSLVRRNCVDAGFIRVVMQFQYP